MRPCDSSHIDVLLYKAKDEVYQLQMEDNDYLENIFNTGCSNFHHMPPAASLLHALLLKIVK